MSNTKIDGLGNKVEHEDHLIGRKDAFHVSAVLCECALDDMPDLPGLKPGQPVVFTGDAYSQVRALRDGEVPHGIVDPFIETTGTVGGVYDGGLFWVIIRPGFTSGVRHDFQINLPVVGEDFKEGQWDCRGCNG